MSMTEVHSLLGALVRGRRIAKQTDEGWIRADVYDATVYINHASGEFSGSARFGIEGKTYAEIESVWDMWKHGWIAEEDIPEE